MRVPLSWLNEFLSTSLTAREADDLLGAAGMAVTRIDTPGWRSPRVVAGRLEEDREGRPFAALPAPEPVRLPGHGIRPAPGTMVAVALPGARLFAGRTSRTRHGLDIVASPARDGDPVGRVCTRAELGLDGSAAVCVLPPGTPPGSSVAAATDGAPGRATEDILHLTVPAELADCEGLWGLAGEISQRDHRCARVAPSGTPDRDAADATVRLSVVRPGWTVCATVLPAGAAPEIPASLRARMELTGLDDADPVVCALRAAAYEYGVRLIAVELAHAGPVDVTVGEDHPAASEGGSAVRWPAELPVHVSARTDRPATTPRLLVLAAALTDVSVDGDRCDRAAGRVAGLLAPGSAPVGATADGPASSRSEMLLDVTEARSRLGLALSTEECARLLEGRGLTIRAAGPDRLLASVPAYRTDLRGPRDLIAEVIRLTGYRALPGSAPGDPVAPRPGDRHARIRAARDAAVACGFQEVVTPMVAEVGPHEPDTPFRAPVMHLRRGGSRTGRIVRRSLLPGLAAVAAAQAGRRGHGLDLVEAGAVVHPEAGSTGSERERPHLAVIRALPHGHGVDAAEAALREVGAAMRSAVRAAGLPGLTIEATGRAPYLHGTAVDLVVSGLPAGRMGLVAGSLLGVPETWTIAAAEIDLVPLLAVPAVHRRLVAPPAHAAVEMDVNLVVPDGVPAGELPRRLSEGSAAVRRVGIVDVYRDPRLPDGHRRVTVRLQVASDWRPVTRQEAATACDEAIAPVRDIGIHRWVSPQDQIAHDNDKDGAIR